MIKVELHDGNVLYFPPDMSDEAVDAAVAKYLTATNTAMVAKELASIRAAVSNGADRIIEAISAPRESVLEKDFAGRPTKSITRVKGK